MATAKKTAGKTAKKAASKSSAKKSATKKSAAKKKESLVKDKRSTGSGPACWPGFERVPGKEAGAKGSCKPKAKQTAGEKKADSRAAAGSKR